MRSDRSLAARVKTKSSRSKLASDMLHRLGFGKKKGGDGDSVSNYSAASAKTRDGERRRRARFNTVVQLFSISCS